VFALTRTWAPVGTIAPVSLLALSSEVVPIVMSLIVDVRYIGDGSGSVLGWEGECHCAQAEEGEEDSLRNLHTVTFGI